MPFCTVQCNLCYSFVILCDPVSDILGQVSMIVTSASDDIRVVTSVMDSPLGVSVSYVGDF